MMINHNKKLKVLHVLGGLWCGGTEAFVMNMYRSIDREKVQFVFLIHEKSKAHYDDEVLSLGGIIYRIPDRTEVGTIKYMIYLIRILFKIKPDVIHAHAMFNSGVVMLASFITGIKKRVCHSHNTADQFGDSISRNIFRTIMRLCIRGFSTDLAACGNEAALYLFGDKILKEGKAHVLKNAVNVEMYKFNGAIRSKVRDELNAGNRLVLGHIGRFSKEKNHEFLVYVFKAVHKLHPDSLLVLIGDGEFRPRIEKKVADLELSGAVKFLGIRNDVSKLMQGMDLFVFPSLFEGFPFVLVEAQAAGLNCIISDTITPDTNITQRLNFLSLKDSPAIWAKKILSSSYKHEDTLEIIRSKGYDNVTMAKWLTDFYMGHKHEQNLVIRGGF
ncbi:glycosyltransferase family 1 protein [Paenibacillus sp. GP183]|uniref:glycosyltransferase family 1 protein n=1 Tax=Paenibacillus sp. GP183 TaxID=1882751 RepID=UPI000B831CBB|nr:glycosyltransferase family 1 protein [Paenibacillus sp. GP183]